MFVLLYVVDIWFSYYSFFFFQAEDGIRDLVRSRGLGDVYKRQLGARVGEAHAFQSQVHRIATGNWRGHVRRGKYRACLLYTSDAADERSSVDLGGRRIIKKKKTSKERGSDGDNQQLHK